MVILFETGLHIWVCPLLSSSTCTLLSRLDRRHVSLRVWWQWDFLPYSDSRLVQIQRSGRRFDTYGSKCLKELFQFGVYLSDLGFRKLQ